MAANIKGDYFLVVEHNVEDKEREGTSDCLSFQECPARVTLQGFLDPLSPFLDPLFFNSQIDKNVPPVPRSLSDLGNRSENSAGRGQILLILQGNSCSIAQKTPRVQRSRSDPCGQRRSRGQIRSEYIRYKEKG